MNNIKTYRKIVNELVRKSFPKLEGINIHIKLKELKMGYMWASKKFFLFYQIKIDPRKTADIKDSQIIGVLAHELIHLEQFQKMNFFTWIISKIEYQLLKRLAGDIEIMTDKDTIKRGYAKDLYNYRKYRLSKASSLTKKDNKILRNYMIPEEIKSYAKKIGKW